MTYCIYDINYDVNLCVIIILMYLHTNSPTVSHLYMQNVSNKMLSNDGVEVNGIILSQIRHGRLSTAGHHLRNDKSDQHRVRIPAGRGRCRVAERALVDVIIPLTVPYWHHLINRYSSAQN